MVFVLFLSKCKARPKINHVKLAKAKNIENLNMSEYGSTFTFPVVNIHIQSYLIRRVKIYWIWDKYNKKNLTQRNGRSVIITHNHTFIGCVIVTAAVYIITHLCDCDCTFVSWRNVEHVTCKARPLHRWYLSIFFIKIGTMGSTHRGDRQSYYDHVGVKELHVTIWDSGNLFFPWNFPVQALKNHGKCI